MAWNTQSSVTTGLVVVYVSRTRWNQWNNSDPSTVPLTQPIQKAVPVSIFPYKQLKEPRTMSFSLISGQARKARIAALASIAILFAIPAGAATSASLAAPPDTHVVASMTASGVQVYECEF